MNTKDLRNAFSKYFQKQGHEKVPSSSLVPINDPTLLFNNAGMNQFKDYFTGKAQAKNPRAVSIQKCVRAGGKHNDLENVGFTARHHTFFEMLGNFSFGDYFKKEAIEMAWSFLTEELKIPKEKLYVTAHHTDQEAEKLWTEHIGVPKERFFYRGDKDNFWEMGEIGPCGPCSEIFYDHGEEHKDPNVVIKENLLDDEDRYVEIWNLVFMQYEKYKENGEVKRRDLPNPCIDTGCGLERLAAVVQGKYNNFDTDVFQNIIKQLEKITGKSYSDKEYTTSFRVVADHIRSSTMLITDGVIPSNEGRGYVLRRIIRRAIRHLSVLGIEKPILADLVDTVFADLGEEYVENASNKAMAIKFLKTEELSFRNTLSSGLSLLEKEMERLKAAKKDTLEGEVVFKLYDTHGFPLDLTALILEEQALKIDEAGFEKLMDEQKERSRGASDFGAKEDNLKLFYDAKDKFGATEFTGYKELETTAKLLAVLSLGEEKEALLFDKTPFYGESGGQAGDRGMIHSQLEVLDTQKPVDGIHAHIVRSGHELKEGETYLLQVDKNARAAIAKNHTATHLLHAALRKVLGAHVKQAGSLVGPKRLRFDFSHPEKVTKEELSKVEQLVNLEIFKSTPVVPEEMSKDEAVAKGAMALFGEKYGDQVRVLEIGDFSIELCGGTHVTNTATINLFKILSESALSAGVRRIEATTSNAALEKVNEGLDSLSKVEEALKTTGPKVVGRLEQLQASVKDKDKEIKALKERLLAAEAKQLLDNPESISHDMVYKVISAPDGSDIRQIGEMFVDKHNTGVALIYSKKGDKASVLLKTFKGNKKLNCSEVLNSALKEFGGRGGGKPEMAQGSIDIDKLSGVENSISSKLREI